MPDKSKPVDREKQTSDDLASLEMSEDEDIEEILKSQNIQPLRRLEDLLGQGADLWESNEVFEEFLKGIYERRQRKESK